MKEKITELLTNALPETDFTSTGLVDDGILDSISLTTIIGELSMEFGINIPYEEIIAENFNSIDAMCELVERLS